MNFHRRTVTFVQAAALLIGAGALSPALAEEPNPATTQAAQPDPREFDRDGKHICGYDLMSESERAGHRSQLHFTKSMEDRDAIRKDLCDRMRARAKERGVPYKE